VWSLVICKFDRQFPHINRQARQAMRSEFFSRVPSNSVLYRTEELPIESLQALAVTVLTALQSLSHAPQKVKIVEDWLDHDGLEFARGVRPLAFFPPIVSTPRSLFEKTPKDESVFLRAEAKDGTWVFRVRTDWDEEDREQIGEIQPVSSNAPNFARCEGMRCRGFACEARCRTADAGVGVSQWLRPAERAAVVRGVSARRASQATPLHRRPSPLLHRVMRHFSRYWILAVAGEFAARFEVALQSKIRDGSLSVMKTQTELGEKVNLERLRSIPPRERKHHLPAEENWRSGLAAYRHPRFIRAWLPVWLLQFGTSVAHYLIIRSLVISILALIISTGFSSVLVAGLIQGFTQTNDGLLLRHNEPIRYWLTIFILFLGTLLPVFAFILK
jgi:hypothetical protein